MQERRKFIRFNASFLLKIKATAGVSFLHGIVQNISMGGLRVALDESAGLSVGKMVSCHLLLPAQTFELSGQIAWMRQSCEKQEAGINFFYIPDYYKEDIYNHISKYYRKELTQKWWQM